MLNIKTIAFEGCDGAGKSTICRQFSDYITSYGILNKVVAFPTQAARDKLKTFDSIIKQDQVIVGNIFLDDYCDYVESIKDDYYIHIFDRSPLSTLVYQQSIDPSCRQYIYSQIQKIQMPKVMVLLSIDNETATSRISKRNKEKNIESDELETRGLQDYIDKYEYEFDCIDAIKYKIEAKSWVHGCAKSDQLFHSLLLDILNK